jgi:hypothetical protein
MQFLSRKSQITLKSATCSLLLEVRVALKESGIFFAAIARSAIIKMRALNECKCSFSHRNHRSRRGANFICRGKQGYSFATIAHSYSVVPQENPVANLTCFRHYLVPVPSFPVPQVICERYNFPHFACNLLGFRMPILPCGRSDSGMTSRLRSSSRRSMTRQIFNTRHNTDDSLMRG